MKAILSIGGQEYLLKSTSHIDTVLKMLSDATPVDRDYTSDHEVFYRPSKYSHRRGVEVKMVPDESIILPGKVARKAIPEKASPEAHNTF